MSTVAIAAVGSRGDVAPLTGLGVCLREAGHRVVVSAFTPFADLITGCGLEFRELPADFSPDTNRADATSKRMLAAMFSPQGVRATGQSILDALSDVPADILLVSPLSELAAHPYAEANGIPSLGVRLQPLSATAAYPCSLLGARSLGAAGNRLTADSVAWLIDRLYGGVVAGFRRDLDLPAVSARALRRRRTQAKWPVLHGYSPAVLPRPSDWRTGLEVVGYWWPAAVRGWQPPQLLEDFLAAGPPPVFVGLGSTVVDPSRADQLAGIVAHAAQRAGVRVVVQSGWAGLDVTGDGIATIGETPHDWLFPQMAAAAHHCGAGTAAAALRAGIPTIGLPGQVGDQRFWARRLSELGASAATISQPALTAERLAAAFTTAVTDRQIRTNAAQLADRIARDDGAARAVTAVESLLHRATHRGGTRGGRP